MECSTSRRHGRSGGSTWSTRTDPSDGRRLAACPGSPLRDRDEGRRHKRCRTHARCSALGQSGGRRGRCRSRYGQVRQCLRLQPSKFHQGWNWAEEPWNLLLPIASALWRSPSSTRVDGYLTPAAKICTEPCHAMPDIIGFSKDFRPFRALQPSPPVSQPTTGPARLALAS